MKEKHVKTCFAVLCAYEAGAIVSGKTPTISTLCRRKRWVEIGLFSVLLIHLHY